MKTKSEHEWTREQYEILKELKKAKEELCKETEIRKEANNATYQICNETG